MIHPWQAKSECAAAAFTFAFRIRFSAVATRNGTHDEEAKPRAFYLACGLAMDAVKTLEDTFEFAARYAHAVVLDAQNHCVNVWSCHIHVDGGLLAGIFYGVLNEIGYRGPQLFRIAQKGNRFGRRFTKTQSFRRKVVAKASELQSFLHDRCEVTSFQ